MDHTKKIKGVWKALLFLALFLLYCLSMTAMTGGICFLKGIFGIPCPGCGGTRAMILLAEGDVLGSLDMNPSSPLLFFCLLNEIRVNYFRKGSKKAADIFLAATVFLSIAVYIVKMKMYFPVREPYVFNSQAFLLRLIKALGI